jgi:thiamine pyrophosphokinase
MRAVIFANGEISNLKRLKTILKDNDFLIAADGGGRYLQMLGLVPALLVGDLDSISKPMLKEFQGQGSKIQQFPAKKDDTDLEIAVRSAIKNGCNEILVCGALGGRFDHSIANLAILRRKFPNHIDVRFDDGEVEVRLIRSQVRIFGERGDLISLIPCSTRVSGVITCGLLYPLKKETLYANRARGVSNVMCDDEAFVEVSSGELLCVHTRNFGKDTR